MSLALQLKDHRLTTAKICYHLPDHPGVLQTLSGRTTTCAPQYPGAAQVS